MEDPIVSDVIIENSAGVGSIVHGHTMVGAGKKDDPLDVNPNLSLDSLSLNTLEIVRPDTGTQFRPLVFKSRDYSLVVRYLWGNYWAIEFGDGKGYRLTNNGFYPSASNEKDLGTSTQSWRKIYVDEIARGGDSFALPEHTGTLATIEGVDNRLENYLKLTGGQLNGVLGFDVGVGGVGEALTFITLRGVYNGNEVQTNISYSPYANSLSFGGSSFVDVQTIVPTGIAQFGGYRSPWKIAYIEKISAGGDSSENIIVPKRGGTMATVEDINEVVGNISNILDYINGEAI